MNSSRWMNYNSFIEVSDAGEIRSHGKVLQGEITKQGYIRIHVSDAGVTHRYLVHRLIATVFLPNPHNLPCVNHIDGDKTNNCVNNLEWCTYADNLRHAYSIGLRTAEGVCNNQSKLTPDDVVAIRKRYVRGRHTPNNSYGLAKEYGVSPKTIQNIIHGRSWTCVPEV